MDKDELYRIDANLYLAGISGSNPRKPLSAGHVFAELANCGRSMTKSLTAKYCGTILVCPHAQPTISTACDDWFCGGWDEALPRTMPLPCSVVNPTLTTGEWPASHAVRVRYHLKTDSHCGIALRRRGVVTDTAVEKTITLHNDEAQLRIQYQLVNHRLAAYSIICGSFILRSPSVPIAGIDMPAQAGDCR
jgi:hypothetical protein